MFAKFLLFAYTFNNVEVHMATKKCKRKRSKKQQGRITANIAVYAITHLLYSYINKAKCLSFAKKKIFMMGAKEVYIRDVGKSDIFPS